MSLLDGGFLHSRRWFKVGGGGSDSLQLEAGHGNSDRATFRFDTNYLSFWNPRVGDFLFNGDVTINGRLVAPRKVGFMADQFVNNLGVALEEGDVVVIGADQGALSTTADGIIPIPEVDLAEQVHDTRVCGVVLEAYANRQSSTTTPEGEGTPSVEAVVFEPGQTSVAPGQIGLMVTLGTFVHCKVDADIASIQPGDLLTTSPTPGHAQKVLDKTAAVGAILGKALQGLSSGKGKIAVFVNIQ